LVFSDSQFWWFFLIVVVMIAAAARTVRSITFQNTILLVSSYYFYAQWDWRFLSLIAVSTLVDYTCAMQMVRDEARKKSWLLVSLIANLGILGFFKYYDFFITEAVTGLNAIGIQANASTLRIILPVGISFYTFQTLTYTIDVYRGQLKPTRDLLSFATFVAFFPQLVAGPIERAANLLPQFNSLWKFDQEKTTEGLRLILFGLVLKIVVADNLAPLVDEIFGNPAAFNGGELALGALYFGFQIYGDFCGYSTIAIGIAKILGFELMTNFRTPYFSASIQEFWRRWHISLSTFFRDYVYIPLGGSRVSSAKRDRNLLLTFAASGLWHGANWTFIFWGVYHGLLLVIQNRLPRLQLNVLPKAVSTCVFAGFTFFLVSIGWVVFRSASISDAYSYLFDIVARFDLPASKRSGVLYVLVAVLLDALWRKDTRLETVRFFDLKTSPALLVRWSAYVFMFWMVVTGVANRSGIQQFIYFQF
jgi:D-alanyl-lipoteichoic acid acyltransferase DltB (MBOAT superfamily)